MPQMFFLPEYLYEISGSQSKQYMKKGKRKLEKFRLVKDKKLDAKLLAKVYGRGDGAVPHSGDRCNAAGYTYSVQIKADIEPSKEI